MIVHDDKQVPHWAPGAADYLAGLLTGGEVAVEWGGGGSSPWLVSRVKHLHTIESNPRWAEKISIWVGDAENFTLHEHPQKSSEYVECLFGTIATEPYVWLIDGYNRIDCLAYVLENSREGDIIVLDDAMDYAQHLLPDPKIHRFKQPHPYAGTLIRTPPYRNTVLTHHAATKETWLWSV